MNKDLAPGKKIATKRSKKTTFANMNTMEQFLSLAQFFPRGVHPFMDIGDVLLYGPEKHWGPASTSKLPVSEIKRQKAHVEAFDKLFFISPDLLQVLKELYAHAKNDSGKWENLVKTMRGTATNARTLDTNGLKHELSLFLPNPHKDVLDPPIPKQESKSECGLVHPMLRHFILGWNERGLLPPLVFRANNATAAAATYVAELSNFFTDNCTNLSAAATTADGAVPGDATTSSDSPEAVVLLKSIVAGTHEMMEQDYPLFFYKEGSYDADDLEKGLLRGDALPRILRHIWVGPRSAINGLRNSIPSRCNARLHGVFKVSPEMIGYAGVQYQGLATPQRQVNYEKLFKNIVKLFAVADDPWAVETLAWFQGEVFGTNTGPDADQDADKEPEADDLVLAQRTARRQAARAASEAASSTTSSV
ncbi:hypothetical protein C8F04DRAFT_1280241 [Mycena alexandri]|uniref:Uncharacterized protein n=1 Tax=Mycena alexandri TaxID=1745969 RepID=A0AAD6RX00_9AGAR|nr:hypothetical protein C8F04DRAFT_1280241 [Mycena alexandri]